MVTINPYLNFKGNTEEAFNFYKSVFGGEFAMIQRFRDTPEAPKLTSDDREKIMHIALPIGKDNVLMGTDAIGPMGDQLISGNNFHISVSAGSEDETKRIYDALAVGGQATVPLAKMFWGSYFGMCVDKFGIQWMVSYDEKREQGKNE